MTGARPTLLAVIALAWVAVLSACGGTSAREAGPRAEIRDAVVSVEVVSSGEAQRRGLGGRESLAWDHGMLFVYQFREQRNFYMRNCFIPLDLAYIKYGKIEQIYTMPPQAGAQEQDMRR